MTSNLLASLIGLLSLLGILSPADAEVAAGAATETKKPAVLVAPRASEVDAGARTQPLSTVGSVDAKRYAGLWYELARLPVRFQDKRSVSTARYSLRPDGIIGVENTSYVGDEQGYRLEGTAEPVDPSRNDRFRVGFGGFLSAIPVAEEGNYWIIELDDDYSTALVGTPDREFLWLLSRDGKAPDTALAQRYLDRAAALGFDTTKLQIADWQQRVMPA